MLLISFVNIPQSGEKKLSALTERLRSNPEFRKTKNITKKGHLCSGPNVTECGIQILPRNETLKTAADNQIAEVKTTHKIMLEEMMRR